MSDIARIASPGTVTAPAIGRRQALHTFGQRLLCRAVHPILYGVCTFLMKYKVGWKIENVRELRRQFKEIAAVDGPLMICPNHLTFVDSALLIWAFGSNSYYLSNFHRFSWNLPAGDFFKKKAIYRFVAAVSKCIFIHRDGSKEHKDSVMKLTRHLLEAGEVVTVFPEGKRSRSGRVELEQLTHGVGKMITEMGGCRVLCVYIRGDKQDKHSNYPAKGSTFSVEMELHDIKPRQKGRDGYHEIMMRIGQSLKGMEDKYFAKHGTRGDQVS